MRTLRREGKVDRETRLGEATLVVPYYRNPLMLRTQLEEWDEYPPGISIVVVDDGSPESAEVVVSDHLASLDRDSAMRLRDRLQVYRIVEDVPWNRGGARNLGTHVATTDWVVHVDVDHLLPEGCARALLDQRVDRRCWYRFPRFRRGRADETRKKDDIPDDVEFGEIKPHVDSYLVTRKNYWRAGGYDEDYSGCLGGGTPFLKALERKCGPPRILPSDVFLCVYTRHACEDASDRTLSRDTSEYSRRRKQKERSGDTRPRNPLRFSWRRAL